MEGGVIFMEFTRRLPKEFFAKVRPHAQPSNDPDDKIIPIKWSKEVMDGKRKAIVKLAKNGKNR